MKWADPRAIALVLILAIAAAVGVWASAPPPPLGADGPAAVFSAGRAMADDRAMAARPHPTGSAEAGLVRAYLIQRMAALGLGPRIQTGEVTNSPRWARGRAVVGARVENLIGVLPGRDPTKPAVLLMAHTDSVPGSPGAADDAAGVASVLEVVRALKAGPAPGRDVAVLLTDAEEAGLLGARAFFASGDPLLKHIGEVVNLEARGGGGRVAMFQTGADDGQHLVLFARAVGDSNANSLTSEVYKYTPNDTDFTVSKERGLPGFNFAFVGREFDYHSPSSTPDALDQGALQHMGDQALAVTRALALAPELPRPAADDAYSDLLGRWVIAYPAGAGWAILMLSLVLGLAAVVHGQRKETGRGVNWGAAGFAGAGLVLITLILAAILWAAGRLLGLGEFGHERAFLAQYPLGFAGFVVLTIGWTLFLVGPVQRGRGWTLLVPVTATRWSAWGGAFLVLAAIDVFLQWRFPPTAVLTAWPLAAAAVLMAIIAFAGDGRWQGKVGLVAATLIGAATLAHLAHYMDETFSAVGTLAPALLALYPLPAAPVVYPLLEGWGRSGAVTQLSALALALIGAAILLVVAVRDPWTARHPAAVQAFFVQDNVAGAAYRASSLDILDPWSAHAIGADQQTPIRRAMPVLNSTLWLAPSQSVPGPRAVFKTLRDGGQVVVEIAPGQNGRELRLALKSTTGLKDVSLDGYPANILGKAGETYWVRWSAPGPGLVLRFTPMGATGELDLQLAEIKDGWPAGTEPPPKPANRMPWGLADTTVTLDELKARW